MSKKTILKLSDPTSESSLSTSTSESSLSTSTSDISSSTPSNSISSPEIIESEKSLDEKSDTSSDEVTDETSNTMDPCKYDLKTEFKKLNCNDENYYSPNCNKFLLKKEIIETKCLSNNEDDNLYLYPNLNDKQFNIKIATKKEFHDTKYDGTIYKNIKEQADILANADFELQPHQAFVKNFLSSQTPYSSLLLYHGLGTGKTCSAIGVCEEMRDYMKQMGITKKIIIVASENVLDNFRLQLFDERKLKLVDGIWNIRACTGNKLLQEINPMNMRGIPKEKIISQIKTLINTYYMFLGYGQFANYIIKTIHYTHEIEQEQIKRKQDLKEKKRKPGEKTQAQILSEIKITLNKRIIKRIRDEFDNRLIVIDEVHNIRKTDDNKNKKVAINLELLVKAAQNMRFLLLSATPLYNSYEEIVWLLNLMNTNDRRSRIAVKDIFDKNGNFKKNGEELLIRKATGYVSFVRGENPYTFPYRVYPDEFAIDHTFKKISYPVYQMNLKKIKHDDKKRILQLYLNRIYKCDNCGECQYCIYKYIISTLRNTKGSLGYTILQKPLESLIISYPIKGLQNVMEEIGDTKYSEELSESFSDQSSEIEDSGEGEGVELPGFVDENIENEIENDEEPVEETNDISLIKFSGGSKSSKSSSDGEKIQYIDTKELTGKAGLARMMNFIDTINPPEKGNFEYKKSTLDNYGKIFSQEKIGKYSSKIKNVLESIFNIKNNNVSEGIILIYSQFIDSGLIPMALALEEMGFTRYGQDSKPLFKNRPTELVDVRTMKPPTDKKNFMPARYSMITGDPRISPNNDFEVKGLTNEDNKNGNKVKVVLISKAGSEGIDFKYIRQVHILEPWYNMNRIEQIIGRAVRNLSHKDLPFEKRNVQIFMYGTILGEENKEEAADLYVYRFAEYKAIKIGHVTRILKETAVDCIINHDQTNFTREIMSASLKEPIVQELSTGEILHEYKVGDAPFSPACDYMASCDYSCRPDKKITDNELNEDTYNEQFIRMNSEKILQRIRMLMKESYFYKKDVLLKSIRTPKEYPYVQIYSALTQLIEDNNEFITDRYGRNGRLVNIGEYYLFQPVELKDKNISIYDRSVPIDYKHEFVNFEINKNIVKPEIYKKLPKTIEDIVEKKIINPDSERIMEEMNKNFEIAREFTHSTKVPRGDDNWYKHCGIVMKKLAVEYPDMNKYLLEFLVAHMIELLMFEDKVTLMNYIYSLDTIEKNSLQWYIKDYFERIAIVTNKFHAILLYNLDKLKIMLLNKNNVWVNAQPEDERELASSKGVKSILTFDIKDYNKIVGFIGYEKNNKYMVFKTKDMSSTRDTGARCDESGKDKTIKKINEILGKEKYTNENTKQKKDTKGNVIHEAIGHMELCVIEEFMLRYYDRIKKENKKWFLTPSMAIYYKLYKVFI